MYIKYICLLNERQLLVQLIQFKFCKSFIGVLKQCVFNFQYFRNNMKNPLNVLHRYAHDSTKLKIRIPLNALFVSITVGLL